MEQNERKKFIDKIRKIILLLIIITAFIIELHILCVILFVIFVILWFFDNDSGHLHF